MLPNLSKLSLSPTDIAMPDPDKVPKFYVDHARERKKMDIDTMFTLFKGGAVFSCTGGKISVVENLKSDLFNPIFELEAGEGGLDPNDGVFTAGSFNLGLLVDRQDDMDALGIKDRVLSYVERDRAFVRISNDMAVYYQIYTEFKNDYEATISYLFQELYMALYAAQNGFGVDVYAATSRSVLYNPPPPAAAAAAPPSAPIPRVVYLLEGGDGDLDDLCSVPTTVDAEMVDHFYKMVSSISEAHMLLIDFKPGNVVFINDTTNPSATKFKCIDFGADFSVILPTDTSLVEFAQFSNCCMFASMVTRMANPGQSLSLGPLRRCLLRFAYPCWKSMSSYYSSVNAGVVTAHDLYTRLVEAPGSQKDSLRVDSLFDMFYQYKHPDGFDALVSTYLFVLYEYIKDEIEKDKRGASRVIKSILKTGDDFVPEGPFLKQVIVIVNKRFAEWQRMDVFDGLDVAAPSTPTKPAGEGREQEEATPLDSWMRARNSRDSNASSPDQLTPLDPLTLERMRGEAEQNKRPRVELPMSLRPFAPLFVSEHCVVLE